MKKKRDENDPFYQRVITKKTWQVDAKFVAHNRQNIESIEVNANEWKSIQSKIKEEKLQREEQKDPSLKKII